MQTTPIPTIPRPRTKSRGLLQQGKLPVGIKVAVAVILMVNFGLLMPFNTSTNFIARTFTTDKVALYFATIVFVASLHHHRTRMIAKIPGLSVLMLLLLSMALSTYLANDQVDPWLAFGRELVYAFFTLAAVVVLRSPRALRAFLRWTFYLTSLLCIITMFNLVKLEDVLPRTSATETIQEAVESQTTIESGFTGALLARRSVLWFDANNFAYLVGIQIIYVMHLLITEKPRPPVRAFRLTMLLMFAVLSLQTLSRGGILTTLIAAAVLFGRMFRSASSQRRIKVAALTALVVVVAVAGSSVVAQLGKRYFFLSGLLGNPQAESEMTGLETARVLTASVAVDECLEKPVLGWGSGKQVGVIGFTGNHVGYLNVLVKYGIVGFLLNVLLCGVIFYRLRRAIHLLEQRNDPDRQLGYYLLASLVYGVLAGFFRGISVIALIGPSLAFYLGVTRMRAHEGTLPSGC